LLNNVNKNTNKLSIKGQIWISTWSPVTLYVHHCQE